MEQYLDQKDGKWHVTFWIDLPKVIIKNKLNFRIKNIVLNDGSLVSDPQINNSKYIFSIHESMLGKKVFFNFSFDIGEISEISRFNIGLCDEKVTWFNNTLTSIENKYFIDISNLFYEQNNIDIITPKTLIEKIDDETIEPIFRESSISLEVKNDLKIETPSPTIITNEPDNKVLTNNSQQNNKTTYARGKKRKK